jgi:hypothetical protein
MHNDPDVTDAYNGLISGHKWWLYLPKDFYEFSDEWMCDPVPMSLNFFFVGQVS